MNNYEKENIGKLRSLLPECTVLLRKNGRFPLDGPCRIAAYGSGVRSTVKGGTGSGEVNSRYFVSIEEGLINAGFDVAGAEWSDAYAEAEAKAKREFREEIRKKAKEEKVNAIAASMGAVMKAPEYDIPLDLSCDAAIYVVSRISGEGNDRLPEKGDFKLTDSEVRDILALDEKYERFMLVINTGGPVDLSPVEEVGNILVLSQLGVETGAALADILLGKAYPSGKLSTTWSMLEDYSTAGSFGERDDTRYTEGIYVGYRYFDAFGAQALFPFGYGLGYTDFSVRTESVRAKGHEITVTSKVTNTGSFAGKEVVQIYVSAPPGKLDKEVKSLAGFVKTAELMPGKSQKLEVSFDLRSLASYDVSTASYLLEKGDYIVLTGTNSADAEPSAVINLDGDVTVRKAKNQFEKPDFEDVKNLSGRNFDTDGIEVIRLKAGDIPTYQDRCRVDLDSDAAEKYPVLHTMSAEDLAYLNTGAFDPKSKMPFVIGDASSSVCGAAGESCGMFRTRGISPIVMADGPAGVRISRRYYEDKKGKHSVGAALPESMAEMLPAPVKAIMEQAGKPKKGAVIKEQYCTAIPIATAIAQSFSPELAEVCGDIVGSEMDIFGIDLWLAPALNIHRSVLCGRNFEYYSEDPLLSGRMAAAITSGVQKHPGRGVTIKHYAANNQETNRYASNSMVSERALREIYLRGFEICIREADPVSLMTSYNLLNGEHTSESRALTTDILFGEFGFDGLVMTDWVIGGNFLLAKGSKYGVPDAAKVAAAGCSMFMPGSRKDFKEIYAGIKNGTVSMKQLRWNASRILYVLDRLGK